MPANFPGQSDERPWLLLIHQIPPKPDYLRVKVGRRLARVGAVAIKNSVYVLPATEQAAEDFRWIVSEVVAGGGEAWICRSTFVHGITDADVEQLFREARARDYEAITAEARATLKGLPAGRRVTAERRAEMEDALRRLRGGMAAVAKIDFFEPAERDTTSAVLDEIEQRLRPAPDPADAARAAALPSGAERPRGSTWVTRQGVFVDRIASAWLVRRFIDPEARFKFIPPEHQRRRYRLAAGEIRFDMPEAEYTHEGDRCTFETLLLRFGLDDPALAQIGEVVHDIDLKDEKYGREDAAGIERVLAGIAATHPDDEARLERGAQLFDGLYALFGAPTPG